MQMPVCIDMCADDVKKNRTLNSDKLVFKKTPHLRIRVSKKEGKINIGLLSKKMRFHSV